MTDQWREVDPLSKFILLADDDLSDLQRTSLDVLYQPIIGVLPYALINNFWRMSHEKKTHQAHSHFETLSYLSVDMKSFYDARLRLEAAGLMKTYIKNNESNEKQYVYRLVSPLSVNDFFMDDLLSVSLLQVIGEDRYVDLYNEFIRPGFDLSEYKDVSRNFLQVFNIRDSEVTNTPKAVQQVKNSINDNSNDVKSGPVIEKSDDFDFNLLLDMLNQSYVNTSDVKKNINLINSEHQLYGIDEIEMAKLIEKATNVTNNVFDPNNFKILVSRQFQSNAANISRQTTNDEKSTETDSNDLNAQEKQLIQSASEYAPIEFLNYLKTAKGGYVHSNEERMISDLVSRQILKPEVINMIVYHLLIDQEKSGLNKNLFEAIADNWSQNNVTNASKAITFIKNRQKELNKPRKPRFNNNRKMTVKETLPDWAKDDEKPKEYGKVNEDKKKELEARIQKLRNSRKEGRE
ncbi:replication initiation and membrane attachment family protein [Apilactobacillus nanyangensis]|uniref:replication initiation and membrane attachment family protein n=1 Tax=Apilactobacillus nanyangensis TaxID=2799579 RepID=UPI001944ECF1|nr:DnaD domain protein [Apilactobacillus nanyangensis]